MEKNKFFYSFPDDFSDEKIQEITQFCFQIPLFQEQATFYIHSQQGAKTKYVEKVIENITDLKHRGTKVVMLGRLFVSGYMRIFLQGDSRIITAESVGIVHLPVLMKNHMVMHHVHADELEKLREKVVQFISERTGLTNQQVYDLNEKRLDYKKLLNYGIATELASNFEPFIYS